MYKKILLIVVSLTLLLSGIPIASVSALGVPRVNEIAIGTIGEPETTDPGWLYDTASAELVTNVYDQLISFKVDRTGDRRTWGKTDEFVPNLATEWYFDPVTDPDHPVMYFKINTTIKFQNDHVITTEDVEYSFERWIVLDHSGGPQWMIYEPLLYPNYGWNFSDPAFATKVDNAIQRNGTHVWFTFATPYPVMIFMQVVAQSWASILPKAWAIEQGCWNGEWDLVQYYHDPLTSPLMDPDPVMCGTGPYEFVEWISGSHWRIERFLDHWAGWPAPECDGSVDVVVEKFISEWPTRKLMFLAGDLDFCYVPRMYMGDVLDQPGIRCDKDLAELVTGGNFYNFNITLTSRYLSPPFTGRKLDFDEIDEAGIAPNFFSDINLRKAFCYSANYTEFLEIAYLGEASYPATPAIRGLPYRRPDDWYAANQYYLNLTEAEYYFKLAWGGTGANAGHDPALVTPGQVWTKGFRLPLTYNVGNIPRKTMAEDEIKLYVESLNTKFHVDVYEVEWGTMYIPELFSGELTLFIIGWLADYPDPHNFFFPFMHTYGAFSEWQHYSNPAADVLIEEGGTCPNETRRQEIYYELQEFYIEDAPSVCTYQPLGRHWERDWVQGWYYNPIYPGFYNKHYWKAPPTGVTIKEIDISVIGSITNVDDVDLVYIGNDGVMYPHAPFEVTIHREDSNTDVLGFFVRAGLNRTNIETGEWAICNGSVSDAVWVGGVGSPAVTAELEWQEPCPTGDYNMSAYAGVSSAYAVDPVPENNLVYETATGIVSVLPFLADFDGDGDMDGDDVRAFLRMWIYYWFEPTGL